MVDEDDLVKHNGDSYNKVKATFLTALSDLEARLATPVDNLGNTENTNQAAPAAANEALNI